MNECANDEPRVPSLLPSQVLSEGGLARTTKHKHDLMRNNPDSRWQKQVMTAGISSDFSAEQCNATMGGDNGGDYGGDNGHQGQ